MQTKLTVKKLYEVRDALNLFKRLEGERRWKFTGAHGPKVRYNLARTGTFVERALEAAEVERQALIKRLHDEQGNPKLTELQGEFYNRFVEEFKAVQAQEEECEIRQIPYSALDVESNQIPVALLEKLLDLVVLDDSEAAAPEAKAA